MTTYILRRLLLMIPTLIGITFLLFMLVALAPGGIGASLTASGGVLQSSSSVAMQQAYFEDRYGLDQPVIIQYFRWLERICPVKFGPRELVSPRGERIRAPRRIDTPPLAWWFDPPTPVPPFPLPEFPPDLNAEQHTEALDRAYRVAERVYAQARFDFVAARGTLRATLKSYAAEIDLHAPQDDQGRVAFSTFQRHSPSHAAPSWPEVALRGAEMLAAHERAVAAERHLRTIFDLSPYPRAGIGLGPVYLAAPDLGISFARQRPVSKLIAEALPVTLLLNLTAFPIIYLIGVPSGMLAATRKGQWEDVGLGTFFICLWSFPVVLAGVLLQGIFASQGAFPSAGLHDADARSFLFLPSFENGAWSRGFLLDTLWHMVLPVTCLVYTGFAVLSKQTRAAMLDNFNADYVRTAKAKGVPGLTIVFRHVFRNSLLPIITMFVAIFPAMLAGSVVIERIFSVPGMGSMIIEAISFRDRELILANSTIIVIVNLLALLLADLLYAMADPRVSYK